MKPAAMTESVAILAGGLATRLRPLTEKVPKILVPVAGKPFLTHQLELLRTQGIADVVLCVGHLGEMIEREFGDGREHGVHLRYSFDGPRLLGTGGALRRALPMLSERFFVLYGDSYLPIEFAPVAARFAQTKLLGLMTVFRNANQFDTSNVWYAENEIKLYDKQNRPPEMQHIDYGLSMFRTEALGKYPADTKFDLADLMRDLVANRQMAGYEVGQRFYEIGSHQGLQELERYLTRRSGD